MQNPSCEHYDGFPDDDEVFERIYSRLRARGVKSDPLPGTPAWWATYPIPIQRGRRLRLIRRRVRP
ncbi:MAG: hypothetical protein C5B60_09250 [Chloroflexi bacterium]|nr:MAG: hypothetical protein C5B60_09250 [Chloroflexota bacterium]